MVVSSVDMTATKLKLRMRCHYYIKHKSYVDVENTNQEDTGGGGGGGGGGGRVILWADCFGLILYFLAETLSSRLQTRGNNGGRERE
jgi:hypothetical protein